MRPEEYLAILARRWWILVVAALVAGLVAFLYSNAQPRTYQVSVRLMAVAQPPDYWLDLYAKNKPVWRSTPATRWGRLPLAVTRIATWFRSW